MSNHKAITPTLNPSPKAGQENAMALKQAAQELAGSQGATLTIPPGDWRISDPGAVQRWNDLIRGELEVEDLGISLDREVPSLMKFIDASELRLDAEGATLHFEGLITPLEFLRCSDIRINGLEIDWVRPPFSVAQVTDINENKVSLRFLEPFPIVGNEPVKWIAHVFEKEKGDFRWGRFSSSTHGGESSRIERADSHTGSVHLKNAPHLNKDDFVVLQHVVRTGTGMFFMTAWIRSWITWCFTRHRDIRLPRSNVIT